MFYRIQFSTDSARFGRDHNDAAAVAVVVREIANRLNSGPPTAVLVDEATGSAIGHYGFSPDPAYTGGQAARLEEKVSELEDRIQRAREYLAFAIGKADIDKADAILAGDE